MSITYRVVDFGEELSFEQLKLLGQHAAKSIEDTTFREHIQDLSWGQYLLVLCSHESEKWVLTLIPNGKHAWQWPWPFFDSHKSYRVIQVSEVLNVTDYRGVAIDEIVKQFGQTLCEAHAVANQNWEQFEANLGPED